MVRPTAPVAPTTATVSFSGVVSGTVRPASEWLSGTGRSIPAGLGRTGPGGSRFTVMIAGALGVPLDELLYGFGAGVSATVFPAHVLGLRFVPRRA